MKIPDVMPTSFAEAYIEAIKYYCPSMLDFTTGPSENLTEISGAADRRRQAEADRLYQRYEPDSCSTSGLVGLALILGGWRVDDQTWPGQHY
uniref:Uncharacterized protein n=1 Tax=Ditylenchus dipsaci TaxID=166011 RepID=A0A915CVH8_9BILA